MSFLIPSRDLFRRKKLPPDPLEATSVSNFSQMLFGHVEFVLSLIPVASRAVCCQRVFEEGGGDGFREDTLVGFEFVHPASESAASVPGKGGPRRKLRIGVVVTIPHTVSK